MYKLPYGSTVNKSEANVIGEIQSFRLRLRRGKKRAYQGTLYLLFHLPKIVSQKSQAKVIYSVSSDLGPCF